MSFGYTNARYTSVGSGNYPTASLPITTNSHFVKAPEFSVSTGAEIRHELDGAGELSLRGDITMYSRIYNDVGNTPIVTQPAYELVNARLSYSLPGDHFQVSLFGVNLTDKLYISPWPASWRPCCTGFGNRKASSAGTDPQHNDR